MLTEVAVKKHQSNISALILLAMLSLNCAQTAKKIEAEPFSADTPQLLWQYDTGG